MQFSSCKPVLTAALLGVGFHAAWARDTVTITIPRHSSLTLVQRLNREGVEAIKKHNYAAAAKLFYKAYLYDPSDPFTLNNLGYISELEGQLDRAGKFYKLAAEQGSNANIDLSNVKSLQGEPMQAAFTSFQNGPTQVNRINLDTVNLEAVNLLSQGRSFEAVALLQQALALDPNDPFTLNNLGAASEATGDLGAAMKYYTAAANSTSHETVAVSQNRSWQGKSVNEMAAANVMRLEGQTQGSSPQESQAALLNLQGVFAENENDWATAKSDFMKAYALDPTNAFSLNNRGYVAERDGDLESAQFFYQKARQANDADFPVGLATSPSAKGQALSRVASQSEVQVDGALDVYSRERRGQPGSPVSIELTPRGAAAAGAPSATPEQPSAPSLPPSNAAPEDHSNQ
jgi:Flp pilus assembly protein TadD